MFIDGFLFLFLFFLYYYGLGSYGLLNNNEGLYAEIPREMLENKQYIIPHLNGVIYIEKPPMLYWLIALSYKIFGVSEASARLIPASAGVGISLITFYFAKICTSRRNVARLSLLILSTMVGMIIFSRMVFFDVLLTFFLSIALFLFYYWHRTEKKKYLRYSYLFLSLAVLTKGIVALALALTVAILFLAVTKTIKKRFFELLDPWGIFLFLLIIIPWHVAACLQEKEFAWFYFINEHLYRFIGLRVPRDYYHGRIYYYVPRLLITSLPWALIFPLIFKKSRQEKTLTSFLWIWILVFVSFFSLAVNKANYYLVTISPPIAILLSLKINEFLTNKNIFLWRQYSAVSLAIFFPCAGLSAIYAKVYLPEKMELFIDALPMNVFIIWLCLSILLITIGQKMKTLLWPEIITSLQLLPILLILISLANKIEPSFSSRKIIGALPDRKQQIVLYRDYEKISSVRFYLNKNIPIMDSVSNDLQFGLHKEERDHINFKTYQLSNGFHQTDFYVILHQEQNDTFVKLYPKAQMISKQGSVLVYKIGNT